MSHRSLATGLAVLLTASMLLALAPVSAHHTPGASAPVAGVSVAPAAAITFTVLNGFGVPTTHFYLGAVGYGTLYFTVTDPLDTSVNVTITDPNAARDKVGTPAFQYLAALSATTQSFDSYTAGVSYAFPSTLPYAGLWNVTFSAPNGGTVSEQVEVTLYSVTLTSTVGTSATLPNQAIGVFWTLNRVSNDATLYTNASNVTIYGSYTSNATVVSFFASGSVVLTPPGTGRGEWTGIVPANAAPNTPIHFEVSAVTAINDTVIENESANLTVNVGALVINGIGLTTTIPSCDIVTGGLGLPTFPAGSLVESCLQVGATYRGGAFTAVPGLPITVGYWNGTGAVVPAGAPTQLTSNASGEAAFTFVAAAPPFSELSTSPIYDALNFTVSVPGASTLYVWTAWSNTTLWSLFPATATGVVQLTLDHSTYYAGVSGTATWSVSSTNLTKTGPLTAVGWTVTGPHGVTYEQGVLDTTGTTGTFPFSVLESMVPHKIQVNVYVANATEVFVGVASATVLAPSVLLTPSTYYYDAGSTPSVAVTLNGGGAGAALQFQAWEYWAATDALLSNGSVANGSSIPIPIASTTPPISVVISVWASLDGQVVASNSVAILLAQGYSIQLGVSTVSSYSDGSFQPGQTVTLHYQVVSVGGAALPQVVSFELYAIGYPYLQTLQNVGPSGSVSFPIPSNAPAGTVIIALLVSGLSAGTCLPAGTCEGLAALYVNPNPSVLNLELGAGSGVTVGWLILLVLVILVALVLVVVLWRRRGPRLKPAPMASSIGPTAAPPEEWKGPAPEAPSSESPTSSPISSGSDSGESSSPPPLPPPKGL